MGKSLILTSFLFLVGAVCSAQTQSSTTTPSTKRTTTKKTSSAHPVVHHATSTHSHGKTSSLRRTSSKRRYKRKSNWRSRGQQNIKDDRAREIQQALIRDHYLSGQPSGEWDPATRAAMVRYQAAHSWQTKVVPDSRALISLGLGPDHDHLLNPESAMTTGPQGQHPVSTSLSTKSDPTTPSSTSLPPTNVEPAASPASTPSQP